MKKLFLLFFTGLLYPYLVSAQVFETGAVTVDQPDGNIWFRIDLENIYTQPVIITSPLTEFAKDPAQVRIKNVTTTSFEYRIEEFEYRGGGHRAESFSYLVIEQGRHIINGQVWEADIVSGNTDGSSKSVPFTSPAFGSIPIVFTQLASDNDPTAAVLRTDVITTDGFKLKIYEEKASTDPTRTAADDVHYLAVQASGGFVGSGSERRAYEVGTTPIDQSYRPERKVSFSSVFSQPILLAAAQNIVEDDPFWLRYRELYGEGVSLRIQEGNSDGNGELSHADEEVGYLVLEGQATNRKRLLWAEYFSLPDQTTSDSGPTAWTTELDNLGSDGDNHFEVRPDPGLGTRLLIAKNTDGEVIWRSETIDIAGYTDVKVSAYIRGDGPPDMDGHLQLYYSIDGGPETPWLNGLQRGRFDPTTAMADGLNGNTLQLIIKARNTTNDDYYKIDNIRVYTESNDRYSIQDGDWRDTNTWSYTPSGPTCSCVPDLLSDTHITDEHTVKASSALDLDTRNLTIYTNSQLRWINDADLNMWGNATLDVKNQGFIERNTDNSIKFDQWNDEGFDKLSDRVDDSCPGNCPEVSVIINSDDPTGFNAHELAFNAKGTYTIQGNGDIHLSEDFDINHQASINNNLLGKVRVAKNFKFHYTNAEFINNGSVIINNDLVYLRDDSRFTNYGDVEIKAWLRIKTPRNSLLTNYGSLTVEENTDTNNQEFEVDNKGTIDMVGNVQTVNKGELLFHNRSGATWTFGGKIISDDIYLFAHEEGNEVRYNGKLDQSLITPRDINDPTKIGPYWHLQLSNQNTDAADLRTSHKYVRNPTLDINGDLTIIGTSSGKVNMQVKPDQKLSVAGHWNRKGDGPIDAIFGQGYDNEVVVFDGNNDQYLYSLETFNYFTVGKTAGKLNVTDEVRVEKEAHFQNGTVEAVNNPFVFRSTASATGGSDDSHVQGKVSKVFFFDDLVSSTNYTIDIYAAGNDNTETMILSLDGSSVQTWTNVGGDANNGMFQRYTYTTVNDFSNLEIRFVEDNGPRDLRIDRVVINGVTFQTEDAELIDNLRDGSCGSREGGWLYCNGAFRWNFSSSEKYTQFTFPVGDGTHYRPIGISNISTSSDVTVEYFNTPPPNPGQRPNEMVNFGACGYWEMSSSHASATGQITLHWGANCPVDVDKVAIAHWDGTKWVAIAGTATGDNNVGKVTTDAAIGEFGLFTLVEITDTPIANDDVIIGEEDTPVEMDVITDSDTDVDGIDPTSVTIVRRPQHGTASVDPLTGIITYTPEIDYFDQDAPDVLTYTVKDTKGVQSNEATVRITILPINDAPNVIDDQNTTNFATVLKGSSVLTNDSDTEGNNLTASLVKGPNNGTLDLRLDGTYTYVPDSTFAGVDSFTYQACDDGVPVTACATANVTITVRPFNYAPQAQEDNFVVEEDHVLEDNLLSNDTDLNQEDVLIVDSVPVRSPLYGTVVLQANGNLIYGPQANFFGIDSLAYQVCDNGSPILCDTTWVIIRVTPVNDAPVAVDDEFSTAGGEEVRGQLLLNDYDVEAHTLGDVTLVSSPAFGQLELRADGSFIYVPRASHVGKDQFTYRVCDGQDPTLCSEATVTLVVQPSPLVIPKGFSPNGDGQGDRWVIQGIAGYPDNNVTVFNRWGSPVFSAQGYDNRQVCWRGKANQGIQLGSKQVPDGTYFYIIDLGDQQKPLSGYLVLKR